MEELNRLSIQAAAESKKNAITIVLDNVRSMNNVGSVFRTSDAFAIEKIILGGYTPTPPHRDIQKTALGATETVAWQHVPELIEYLHHLKANNYTIIAIEQAHNSVPLQNYNIDKAKKYALVFGNEVEGVQQDIINICDHIIEIPQGGSKHSLNISVSMGVVAWQFYYNLGL